MRDPASPDQPKALETEVSSEASTDNARIAAVSLPDRRRIDSDVRAFLREPSTPWIVFDQEGRPPSQLAVGEVLTVPRKTLLSDYDFFPATAAVDGSSAARLEPSSLAVAADLESEDERAADLAADALLAGSLPMAGLSRRVLGASAAAVALMSLLVVGVFALRGSSPDMTSSRSTLAAQPAQRSFGGAVPAEVPPPDLAPAAVTPAAAAPAVVAPPTPVAAPARDEAMSRPASKRWGRLSVAGDARGKDVFMDGKRMLGRGARSFTVMCGTHSIAIGNRADAHDVDVPCNAELVLGK
jgi:hypothetical protein